MLPIRSLQNFKSPTPTWQHSRTLISDNRNKSSDTCQTLRDALTLIMVVEYQHKMWAVGNANLLAPMYNCADVESMSGAHWYWHQKLRKASSQQCVGVPEARTRWPSPCNFSVHVWTLEMCNYWGEAAHKIRPATHRLQPRRISHVLTLERAEPVHEMLSYVVQEFHEWMARFHWFGLTTRSTVDDGE